MAWYDENAALKIKDSESLCATFYGRGGEKPLYAITEAAGNVFTLYMVNGPKLQKIKTADYPRALERYIEGI